MKKIISLILFLFIIANSILAEEPCDDLEPTACDWWPVDTFQFTLPNCPNCIIEVIYKYRHCLATGGSYYPDDYIFQLYFLEFKLSNGCGLCEFNLFLETIKAILINNPMGWVYPTNGFIYNLQAIASTCWKTVGQGLYLTKIPCGEVCCLTGYRVHYTNGSMDEIETISEPQIENSCVSPCIYHCNDFVFHFQMPKNTNFENNESNSFERDKIILKNEDKILLEVECENIKEIIIYSYYGQVIKIWRNNKLNKHINIDQFNLNDLTFGIYLARFIFENRKEIIKKLTIY